MSPARVTSVPATPPVPEPTVTPVPVWEAWSAVMADVQAISKDSRNDQQRFNFRGIDQVMNTVGPVLRKCHVVVLPHAVTDVVRERYDTRNGTAMVGTTLTVTYRIYGPAGDWLEASAAGEASDSGDKGLTKAMSVAYRTLFLQGLCIPTDEADPDAESHTRASADDEDRRRQTAIDMGRAKLREIAQVEDPTRRAQEIAAWKVRAEELGLLTAVTLNKGASVTLERLADEVAQSGTGAL